MAQVPPAQTQRILEFFELVTKAIADNVSAIYTPEHEQVKNAALTLLRTMSDAGIGLTFPDAPPKEEEPQS